MCVFAEHLSLVTQAGRNTHTKVARQVWVSGTLNQAEKSPARIWNEEWGHQGLITSAPSKASCENVAECCRWYANTQANHWAKTSLKMYMKGRILGGTLKWKYERSLVLTCENGGSGWVFVLSFAYDSEVSFVSCLSGLISIWKGYFWKKKNGKP